MVYIGVDLHRKVSQVAAVTEAGELVANRRVASNFQELFRVFGELAPEPSQSKVAFEATFGWGWFADLLRDAGMDAHMSHPLLTKAIANARVKNDAVDAKTLAQLLRTGMLPEAWIAPPEVREARRLVRMRVSLTRMRSRLKAQVHALLAEQGIANPMTDLFGKGGRQLLDELRLPDLSQGRLEACLRLIDDLGMEIEIADTEILALYETDPRAGRLLPIPGIGPTTAAIILAEVGDIARFPDARHLCAWAGLTPTEHSSADHTRRGHISKQGSRWLRWIMVEAATHALTNRQLGMFFTGIEKQRGTKIARVALAHRLLTLGYYALRDEGGCRAFPPPPQRSPSPVRGRARSHIVMAS
ncbi:MAG: IS110 family transposase [Candidatus Dormibacteraceae bacterium]